MARARGDMRDMRDVELVEVLDEPAPPGGGGPPGPGGPAPAPTRWSAPVRARLRAVALLLVAVVVAAVAGSAVTSHRRETARLRALADVPGVLAPLAGPVEELWRVDGWPVGGLGEVDGRLVTVLTTPHLAVDAVALDPRTGREAWRTTVPSGAADEAPADCVLPGAPPPRPPAGNPAAGPDDRAGPDGPSPAGPGSPGPVLVCVVADEIATTTEGSGRDSFTYTVRARLVVVDARSGTVLRDRPVTPPVSVSSVGADVVLGSIDERGRARVTRTDPRSGEERWAFTSPGPVAVDQFGLRRVRVRSDGDLVLADAGTVWVLSTDGEVLRELPGEPDPFDTAARSVAGGRLVARSPVGDAGLRSEVVDVATGGSTTVDGYVVAPDPDDRSLPGLLLVAPADGAGLEARDPATGRTVWTAPGHDAARALVLDGRVVGVTADRVEALDGRTGRVVWSTPAPGLVGAAVVTDGRVVVASAARRSGGTLIGVDARDGRSLWSTDLEDQPYLFTAGGRLFGYGRTGLVAFGARPGAP